jgi:long-chain acyl-CoA synthetase
MTETQEVGAAFVPFSERRTVARLWQHAIAQPRSIPAYLVQRDDGWEEISWEQAAERVADYANGLLARGVRKGDAFGIVAQTTLEWALFDLALAQIGAVGAAIYANSSPRDVAYILGHSEAVGVLAQDEEQIAKVERHRTELPRLQHVISFAGLDALAEEGRAYAGEHPDALPEAREAVEEDDLFTFIYTSGTTGPPKGCMISHRNEYEMVSVGGKLDHTMADDVMLLYLPLAHNFGRLMHLSGPYLGYTIAFLPDPLQAANALLQVRPTVFPSVPRVYEKVHTGVVAKFDEASGVKRKLVDWALRVGRRASELRQQGKPLPRGLAVQHAVADRLVYSKIKKRLGGRLRTAISGGAPLAPEIIEFFAAIDILIFEGYGLTECTTAATTNLRSAYRFGTVGRALPGFELKLAEDGELLIRSPTVFQGYYKDPEATAEVLTPDGWLRTGDIAEIDEDGFVRITDRKKDILVTAGGKNVAPQNLENDLKTSKLVSQALVVGDKRPYVAALVTLDPVELEKWAAANGVEGDMEALARDPRVQELVQSFVDDVNAERSRYEQIKRVAVLPRDFTMEDGEITPTLKLKRRVVQEHFSAEIDGLYAGEA